MTAAMRIVAALNWFMVFLLVTCALALTGWPLTAIPAGAILTGLLMRWVNHSEDDRREREASPNGFVAEDIETRRSTRHTTLRRMGIDPDMFRLRR